VAGEEEKVKVDVSQGRWNLTANVSGKSFSYRARRLLWVIALSGFRIWRFFNRTVILRDGLLKDRIRTDFNWIGSVFRRGNWVGSFTGLDRWFFRLLVGSSRYRAIVQGIWIGFSRMWFNGIQGIGSSVSGFSGLGGFSGSGGFHQESGP
jgi:hypothetical protein